MLFFIGAEHPHATCSDKIQIHLMLFFITNTIQISNINIAIRLDVPGYSW